MSTIDNLEIVKEMIRNEGRYKDDPPVARITAYMNAFNGATCYGVDYTLPTGYAPSATVRLPLLVYQPDDTIELAIRATTALADCLSGMCDTGEISKATEADILAIRHMSDACRLRLSRWVE